MAGAMVLAILAMTRAGAEADWHTVVLKGRKGDEVAAAQVLRQASDRAGKAPVLVWWSRLRPAPADVGLLTKEAWECTVVVDAQPTVAIDPAHTVADGVWSDPTGELGKCLSLLPVAPAELFAVWEPGAAAPKPISLAGVPDTHRIATVLHMWLDAALRGSRTPADRAALMLNVAEHPRFVAAQPILRGVVDQLAQTLGGIPEAERSQTIRPLAARLRKVIGANAESGLQRVIYDPEAGTTLERAETAFLACKLSTMLAKPDDESDRAMTRELGHAFWRLAEKSFLEVSGLRGFQEGCALFAASAFDDARLAPEVLKCTERGLTVNAQSELAAPLFYYRGQASYTQLLEVPDRQLSELVTPCATAYESFRMAATLFKDADKRHRAIGNEVVFALVLGKMEPEQVAATELTSTERFDAMYDAAMLLRKRGDGKQRELAGGIFAELAGSGSFDLRAVAVRALFDCAGGTSAPAAKRELLHERIDGALDATAADAGASAYKRLCALELLSETAQKLGLGKLTRKALDVADKIMADRLIGEQSDCREKWRSIAARARQGGAE